MQTTEKIHKYQCANHFSLDRTNQIVIRSAHDSFCDITAIEPHRWARAAALAAVDAELCAVIGNCRTDQAGAARRARLARVGMICKGKSAAARRACSVEKRQCRIAKNGSNLLGNDNLDLDFLDERARLVLGLVGRDETIVFKPTRA